MLQNYELKVATEARKKKRNSSNFKSSSSTTVSGVELSLHRQLWNAL